MPPLALPCAAPSSLVLAGHRAPRNPRPSAALPWPGSGSRRPPSSPPGGCCTWGSLILPNPLSPGQATVVAADPWGSLNSREGNGRLRHPAAPAPACRTHRKWQNLTRRLPGKLHLSFLRSAEHTVLSLQADPPYASPEVSLPLTLLRTLSLLIFKIVFCKGNGRQGGERPFYLGGP